MLDIHKTLLKNPLKKDHHDMPKKPNPTFNFAEDSIPFKDSTDPSLPGILSR